MRTYHDSARPINTSSNPKEAHAQIDCFCISEFLFVLLCHGFFLIFFLYWSFVLSWVPFASLCVWLEGEDGRRAASVPARGLEQITYDIKHMAAVRKEKRRETKKKCFLQKKKRKKSKAERVRPGAPSPFFSSSLATFLFSFLSFRHDQVHSCQSNCQTQKQRCLPLVPFHPANKTSVPF